MSQAVFFYPPTSSTASVKKGLMGKGGEGKTPNNQITKIKKPKTKHCHKKPLEFMKKSGLLNDAGTADLYATFFTGREPLLIYIK